MIEINGISKSFGGVQALDTVNTIFYDGEIHGLVGENGAGKSTLMKILSGVYKQDTGKIYLNDKELLFNSPQEAYNAGIRIVHQELSLINSLTVAENIFIHQLGGLSPFKFINREKLKEDAKNLLGEWGIDIDPTMLVGDMTIGLKQLVEIVRELSTKGKIIILDEPTSSLTNKEIDRLFAILRRLKKNGYVIVFISHRLNEVTELVDRITVLRDGHLIIQSKTKEMNSNEICRMIANKETSELYPKFNSDIGETACKVENLTGKHYRNISFEVKWGEILGIAGLVGAGRSEVLRSIYGVYKHDGGGKVYISGEELKINYPDQAVKKGIVYLSENRSEDGNIPTMSTSKNIIILKIKDILRGMLIKNKLLADKSQEMIEKLNIICANPMTQTISELSGGNQQKVLFGRLLRADPKILLIDEPTRGVDVFNKTEIHKIIGNFVQNGGAVIMVSSEIEEVIGISDRLVVLNSGNLVGRFNRNEFNKERILRCMMGLEKTN